MLKDAFGRGLTALLGGGAHDFAVKPPGSRTQPNPAIEIRIRKRARVTRAERLGEVGELEIVLAHSCKGAVVGSPGRLPFVAQPGGRTQVQDRHGGSWH